MKYYLLKSLTQYLKQFYTIKHIKRVENNTIKIEFNNQNIIYFDMTKGQSTVYKKQTYDLNNKNFNAPFDIMMQKKFINAKIVDIYLKNDDKILNIKVKSRSSYKEDISILQFEFTGKNTNVIILDKQDIVLEALRHIDEYRSTRVVQVGQKLEPLKKLDIVFEDKKCEDIEQYLFDIYTNKQEKILDNLKKQKILKIKKDISKINNILNSLEDSEVLNQKAKQLNQEASQIVANLYKYSGYEKMINLQKSQDMFKDSKKLKQKAKNQYLEKNNLKQKLDFYYRLQDIVQTATTIDEIEFYLPKKDKNQIKTKKANPYQAFFIDGYKIMLGRDERENIYLLQNSKASDFWFHLQQQVSSHVIVSNSKKELPPHIIEEAAKICAKFSTNQKGIFRVDYTQRRNVKIQNKANVLYNPYKTIVIKII
jgi:predicted ribosome quality control (RQC) complex YloA/Tae2 family protein